MICVNIQEDPMNVCALGAIAVANGALNQGVDQSFGRGKLINGPKFWKFTLFSAIQSIACDEAVYVLSKGGDAEGG